MGKNQFSEDKKISDVDKKNSDVDKKISDVDKKSSDVLALDLYTSLWQVQVRLRDKIFVRQTWTNFRQTWTNFCQTSHNCPYETTPKNKK